jgi:hypothetical protein
MPWCRKQMRQSDAATIWIWMIAIVALSSQIGTNSTRLKRSLRYSTHSTRLPPTSANARQPQPSTFANNLPLYRTTYSKPNPGYGSIFRYPTVHSNGGGFYGRRRSTLETGVETIFFPTPKCAPQNAQRTVVIGTEPVLCTYIYKPSSQFPAN